MTSYTSMLIRKFKTTDKKTSRDSLRKRMRAGRRCRSRLPGEGHLQAAGRPQRGDWVQPKILVGRQFPAISLQELRGHNFHL